MFCSKVIKSQRFKYFGIKVSKTSLSNPCVAIIGRFFKFSFFTFFISKPKHDKNLALVSLSFTGIQKSKRSRTQRLQFLDPCELSRAKTSSKQKLLTSVVYGYKIYLSRASKKLLVCKVGKIKGVVTI